MMQIVTAIFYLTRKCNLNCSYCRVRDNSFPNELSIEDKLRVLDVLKKLNVGFVILFGGEPLMIGKDLNKIVRYCRDIDISYAITSNSVMLTKEWTKELVSDGLLNWSVSVDAIKDEGDSITLKSSKGIRDLLYLKELGVKDLHATLTLTRKNIDIVVDILEQLNAKGIWMEITALHYAKDENYYFASKKEEMEDLLLTEDDLPKLEKLMNMLKEKKRQGYLIHNEAEFFDEFKKYALNLNWRCKYPLSTIVIDADGNLKTCLHYDRNIVKYSIFDLLDEDKLKEFETLQKEEIKYCKGCFWDCRWQAEYWLDKDYRKGVEVFRHNV